MTSNDTSTMPDANTWDVSHPGRWSRNGAPQSKLPRKYGLPRDEGAWAAGTLAVYDTYSATSSCTGAFSSDAAADPITGVDPT